MRPRLLAWPLAVAALVGASGCASPTEGPGEEAASAIRPEQAAKEYEFASRLFKGEAPSAATAKLGVASWAAYAVSDSHFYGLALFAVDARSEVKFVVLVNAKRAADGKSDVAIFAVDEGGKRTGRVTGAAYEALLVDLARLQAPLRATSKETGRTAGQRCAVGLASAALTVVAAGGAALLVGWGFVAWDALVFAESLGATFGGFGLTLGSAAGASAMVLTVELAYQETVDNLGACAE